ncbi:MAG: orotate phosphoribosyltransferase [Anaerolineae bacterium]|nr:orotate phosphoribosyltransferase [Anaerolineae bacterium]
MSAYQRPVAQALLHINAVGFSPQQPITFKSGLLAPVYVDNRRLPYHPAQWRIVIEAARALVTEQGLALDVIAGVATGGIPHSAALGYLLQQPSIFIRKEAKEYGAQQRIEGGEVAGRRVLLVEDMITTGGSSLSAIAALREAGALVTDVLAIISYGFAEAGQALAAAGVRLHTLTQFDMVLAEAQAQGRFTPAEAAIIHEWFADPPAWGRKHGTP